MKWMCILTYSGEQHYTRTIMRRVNSLYFYDYRTKCKIFLHITDMKLVFLSDKKII